MRRVLQVSIAAAVVGTLVFALSSPAAPQSSEKPTATDIGVTADTIRIAVVADVDQPFFPGGFKGARDAVIGAAKYINAHGGIAGRKLAVDFYDSKLNPNETRNALIKACDNDFALVGTTALFVTSVEDLVNCKDSAGRATGVPDLAGITTSLAHSCSKVTFPSSLVQVKCDTLSQDPPTAQDNIGPYRYYDKKLKGAHGALLFANDTPDARREGASNIEAAKRGGIVADVEQPMSALSTQSAFTPIIQTMKAANSNFSYMAMSLDNAVELRQEATLQGLDSSKVVWTCPLPCYDEEGAKRVGSTLDGEKIILQFLPFEEARQNKMVANFLKYTGKDKVDGYGAWAWASAIALQQVLSDVVKKDGVNGVTRANLLAGLEKLRGFNADGMIATTDVGTKALSPCFMLAEWRNGKYSRVYPTKKGTFDCNKSNVITFPAPAS
jgi:ABC-type branched-subunit amino acid transport system substrate-binding protein